MGGVLYDANEHPVMFKKYEFDELTNGFSELLEEQWNMQHLTF